MSETRPQLPVEVEQAMKQAERLAWISIAFLISIILAMAAVMGGSQPCRRPGSRTCSAFCRLSCS
jgi:hypothetical protein